MQYYIESLDALKSAQKAGYKTISTKLSAEKLLLNKNIMAEIHARIELAEKTLDISQAYIIKKLLQIITKSSEIEPLTDKNGNLIGGSKLKDPTATLRAIDLLAKFVLKEKPETLSASDIEQTRIFCIENLNDNKI